MSESLLYALQCIHTNTGSLPTPGVTTLSNGTHAFLSPTLEALSQANRFIVSYQRQDLNVPLDVEYQEVMVTGGNTAIVKEISIPGVMYAMKIWSVNGSQYSPTTSSFIQLLQLSQGEEACTIMYPRNRCKTTPLIYCTYLLQLSQG